MATAQTKAVGRNLTEGAIAPTLVAFALPIILANVIQQAYSMTDLIIIGQFVGNTGTVGVSTGGEIADWMTPLGLAMGTGAQILVAQLIGAKRDDTVKETIGTTLTLSALISIVLAAISIIFCGPILRALNCPEEAFTQARNYMIITSLGFPFIFGYNAVVGILRGMGEAKRPLLFIIVAATVNIFTDLLLVAVIPLEAAGTAIATVASQIGSFVAAFYFLYKNREKFDFEFKPSYFRMNGGIASQLLKLAIPQAVRSSIVRFSLLYVNAQINGYGLTFSAANSVGNKLQKFLEVFMQGLDTASATMIGQNLGARKIDRVKKTVWMTLLFTMTFAVIGTVLCLAIPQQMYGLFTKDAAVKALGVTYLAILVWHLYGSAFIGAFQALVTGCGFVELGFAIGIIDGVVCKIGLSYLIMAVFHAQEYSWWWGTAFSRYIPGLLCFGYFMSGKWKNRKLLSDKVK